MADKVSKASVNYRPAPAFGLFHRCGNCAMYQEDVLTSDPPQRRGSCTLVAGTIKRIDLCDRWEPKR